MEPTVSGSGLRSSPGGVIGLGQRFQSASDEVIGRSGSFDSFDSLRKDDLKNAWVRQQIESPATNPPANPQ
eukprot:5124167-Prorocentrum_lima.AAC.1